MTVAASILNPAGQACKADGMSDQGRRQDSSTVDVGDISVHFRRDGRADGPVVVMAHALGTDLEIWDHQMAALEGRYRIVRYDWRGHGGTDAPPGPYSLDQLVGDAAGLLDMLQLDRVHWVGLSTGGMIGQGLAISHPERVASLSLCNTACHWPNDEIGRNVEPRRQMLDTVGMTAVWEATKGIWFTDRFVENESPEYHQVRKRYCATTAAGHLGAVEAARHLDYRHQLGSITAPALILSARDDPITPLHQGELMHELIGDSRWHITDGRHFSNVEFPDQFNPVLRTFLDDMTA